jgi:hypothetical protein
MMQSTLPNKLGIKPNYRILLFGLPDEVRPQFDALPDGATIATASDSAFLDVVCVFARTKGELDSYASTAMAALKPGGILWGFYPKGTSGAQTDLSRDRGWEAFTEKGLEIVGVVSVDSYWSGSRYKPSVTGNRKTND